MHLEYFSFGQSKSLNLNTIKSAGTTGPAFAMAVSPGSAPAKKAAGNSLPDLKAIESLGAIKGGHPNSQVAWHELNISDARYMVATDGTFMVVTDSIMVEGIRKTDLKRLRDDLGFEVVREGEQGRLLLRAPVTENAAFSLMQKALDHLKTVKAIKAAHPHFIRTIFTPKPSAAGGMPLWNHNNTGNPGVAGADVAALAAWTITKGNPEIRVAVLDEGVDSKHPNLRKRIVAELDVVGGNSHARPNGNDAHGTACAGIIASQSKTYPGLAPDCSLIGVRIAKGNGNDGWIIDDFDTADAIEWSWKEGKADVLSNSWGGGPAVDSIINAIKNATKKGRGGKGAVVVFAAGNDDGAISFPGSLDTVLTVGASTPWDERKSPTSKDGEGWWGSCYGPALDLLAPGVKIATTDISGTKGYSNNNHALTFNGTSSATPHVAAAAALVLSVRPDLKENQVREILTSTCDRLSKDGKWHKEYGWGRLNVFSALRKSRTA